MSVISNIAYDWCLYNGFCLQLTLVKTIWSMWFHIPPHVLPFVDHPYFLMFQPHIQKEVQCSGSLYTVILQSITCNVTYILTASWLSCHAEVPPTKCFLLCILRMLPSLHMMMCNRRILISLSFKVI